MNDILAILNNLSKALQAADLHIVMVDKVVAMHVALLRISFPAHSARSSASTMSACAMLRKLEQKDSIDHESLDSAYQACLDYVERLVDGLGERFPGETQEAGKSLSALYPFCITKAEILSSFGNDAVIHLAKVYDLPVEANDIHLEYGLYKQSILASYAHYDAKDFFKLALVDVDCERAFSFQNNIKTNNRSRLSTAHLNDLLVCAQDGPPLECFDTKDNMMRWLSAKKRRFN
ncbi:hypothetical protein ACHHYP_16353 [Achlya hypogyna]|uniref:HAT C-terminal dimerisation domain-containing protein n=1 Tax=Achlya hypogyna TaxID=1202772 RepID=A0A1V9Y921_ACHHY|nr:hypothetical protein ACHHYP_16353 [Achlya hypogyna]